MVQVLVCLQGLYKMNYLYYWTVILVMGLPKEFFIPIINASSVLEESSSTSEKQSTTEFSLFRTHTSDPQENKILLISTTDTTSANSNSEQENNHGVISTDHSSVVNTTEIDVPDDRKGRNGSSNSVTSRETELTDAMTANHAVSTTTIDTNENQDVSHISNNDFTTRENVVFMDSIPELEDRVSSTTNRPFVTININLDELSTIEPHTSIASTKEPFADTSVETTTDYSKLFSTTRDPFHRRKMARDLNSQEESTTTERYRHSATTSTIPMLSSTDVNALKSNTTTDALGILSSSEVVSGSKFPDSTNREALQMDGENGTIALAQTTTDMPTLLEQTTTSAQTSNITRIPTTVVSPIAIARSTTIDSVVASTVENTPIPIVPSSDSAPTIAPTPIVYSSKPTISPETNTSSVVTTRARHPLDEIINATDEITDYLLRFEGACSDSEGSSGCELRPFLQQKALAGSQLTCLKVVQLRFTYAAGSSLADSQAVLDTFKDLVGKLEIKFGQARPLRLVEVKGLSLDFDSENGTTTANGGDDDIQMGRLSYSEFVSYIVIGCCFGCLILFAFCLLCAKCLKSKSRRSRFQDLPHLSLQLEDYRLTKIPRPTTIYNNDHSRFAEDVYSVPGQDIKSPDTDSSRLSAVYDTAVIPLEDFPNQPDRYSNVNGHEMQTFRSRGSPSKRLNRVKMGVDPAQRPKVTQVSVPNPDWRNIEQGRENPIYRS